MKAPALVIIKPVKWPAERWCSVLAEASYRDLRAPGGRGGLCSSWLLGAPGRSSPAGEAWLAAARTRDIVRALAFSGVLSAQDLSDALAACDILLFADTAGPSSRKTTLAASLASGRPVIAIDGPARWSELVQSEAVRLTPPAAHTLAGAIRTLLADEDLREALGARGRMFAEQRMSVGYSVQVVSTLLSDVVSGRERCVSTLAGKPEA